MKIKSIIQSACLILTTTVLSSHASVINVPSGNFTNVTAIVSVPPILGTNSGAIGFWTGTAGSFASLGGSIQAGPAATLGGPTSPSGAYELVASMPGGVATTMSLSQMLTNHWQPNSTYTLTVGMAQSAFVNLLVSSILSLNAGTTSLASGNVMTLAGVGITSTSFQTVTLTYKTGNTVPTNCIGISLTIPGLLGVNGNVYVNNVQLSVIPNQVVLNAVPGTHGSGWSFSGSGCAPYETYEIVTMTNLLRSMPTWDTLVTNQCDASGNFSIQFQINTNTPARFFRVLLP